MNLAQSTFLSRDYVSSINVDRTVADPSFDSTLIGQLNIPGSPGRGGGPKSPVSPMVAAKAGSKLARFERRIHAQHEEEKKAHAYDYGASDSDSQHTDSPRRSPRHKRAP